MKLSTDTREVLKNYSTINSNLLVNSGNQIATMSQMKNIVSKATLPDTFETEFAIYDLNEFLAALSLFKNPILDFDEQFVTIKEEQSPSNSLKYFYSDPSVVQSPSKTITMPSEEVTFELSSGDLSKMKKASAVIGAPDMTLERLNGSSSLVAKDKKNDTANSYSTSLDTKSDDDASYKFWFKVENLKLQPGNYDVEVSEKRISHFQNKKIPIEYWIALEPESTYGK